MVSSHNSSAIIEQSVGNPESSRNQQRGSEHKVNNSKHFKPNLELQAIFACIGIIATIIEG
jgi:hypothetical protein